MPGSNQPPRAEWTTPDGALLGERRTVEPGGRLVSAWRVPWVAPGSYLVAFTAQPGELVGGADRVERGIR